MIHFLAPCNCWNCDECRAKLKAEHIAKIEGLFTAAQFYKLIPKSDFEAEFARVGRESKRRECARPEYVRIEDDEGKTHLFYSWDVAGTMRRAAPNAVDLARQLINRIKTGGRHVMYSTGRVSRVDEIKRYTVAAIGVTRRSFENVMADANANVKYIGEVAFAPKPKDVEPDTLIERMRERRRSPNGRVLGDWTKADEANFTGCEISNVRAARADRY